MGFSRVLDRESQQQSSWDRLELLVVLRFRSDGRTDLVAEMLMASGLLARSWRPRSVSWKRPGATALSKPAFLR